MKKMLFPILALVLALGLTLPMAAPAAAHTEDAPQTQDLLAGQDINVGTVSVWNDKTTLYVQYMTDADWVIGETHLAVATSLEGIPQTRKGNPKVGKFTYQTEHDPWVPEHTYAIPVTWDTGTELCIAAHAVVANVANVQTMTVMSDTTDLWWSGATGDDIDIDTGYIVPPSEAFWSPAALCWVHSEWTNRVSLPGASWIWKRYQVTQEESDTGDIVFFKKQIDIPLNAFNIQATLLITADNAYYFYVNDDWSGEPDGIASFVSNYDPTDFYYKDAAENLYPTDAAISTAVADWSSIEVWPIRGLRTGENWLQIVAINEHAIPSGPANNPAGLIYKAQITYLEKEETAWAEGTRFTTRGNWATYFTYEIQ